MSLEDASVATRSDVWASINRAKRAELREMLDAAEAEGGSHTSEDVRRHVRGHLDRLNQTPKAS